MARADKVEVALSNTDRQLLRDIRDALRAMGGKPEDEGSATDAVRRLMESENRASWGHYTWNGSGWVPLE